MTANNNMPPRAADLAALDDEAFAREAVGWLEAGNERLDAATRSRLNQARHAALAHARPARRGQFMRWGLPLGGVAAAVTLAVMLLPMAGTAPSSGQGLFEDLEIVMAEDSLEMLEDLEFYEWLSVEDAEAI